MFIVGTMLAYLTVDSGCQLAVPKKNEPGTSGDTTKQIVPYSYAENFVVDLDLPDGAKPLEMSFIKAGSFIMGCTADADYRIGREWLSHEVNITKPFCIGKYEVTQAQWQAVMKENPAKEHWVGYNYPVYNINWNDTQEFIRKLNLLGQGKFRLPTEAEWEYACRAGTETRFFFGQAPNCGYDFDYCKKSDAYLWWGGNNGYGDYPEGTKEVGLKKPNPLGLYDIYGNVWELCQDYFHKDKLKEQKTRVDPLETRNSDYMVIKGGAWSSPGIHTSSADRTVAKRDSPMYGNNLGLRLVRE